MRRRKVTPALAALVLVVAVPLTVLPRAEARDATAAQGVERLSGGRDGDDLDALVLGRAGSPALRAMRDVVELDTVRRANVRRLRPHRYDMAVVDGDHLTPRRLRRHPALQRFVGKGRWIAAFDVRPSHHEALATYTGFDVADRERSDRSEVFVFRVSKVKGTPTVEMIDSGPYSQRGSARLGERRKAKLSRSHVRRVARLVDRHIGTDGATAAADEIPRVACEPPNPAPDSDLQHVGYCYVDAGQKQTDLGYWTFARLGPWDVPDHGFQTSKWTMSHRFDVFLNNDAAHPQGNFQTVTYSLNGQFNPASGGKFFRMNDVFKAPTLGLERIAERAWWTGQIRPEVTPDDEVTDSKLLWQAGHPESPNSETTYQSGEEFSIGFNGTGGNLSNVAGGGINLGYSASNSKSYSIPDWGVENKGSGNELDWLFSARQPCDTRVAAANPTACSSGLFGSPRYQPTLPNALSLGQIQVNTSGRWRTREHLTDRDGSLTFEFSTPVRIVDTYSTSFNPTASEFFYSTDRTAPYWAEDVTIDASAVNPIPIKELKLSPTPANGAKNDKVTGTVVLEGPAKIPVTVKLFSNSGNAVLGAPYPGVPGGSQSTITINQGKSSGTFTVATNDNKLGPGQHTTANITAFYTEPRSAQLRVQRP